MPRMSNKSANTTILSISDFSGGENLSINPELLQNNELQKALNLEFDNQTRALSKRPGLSSVLHISADGLKIENITKMFNAIDYILVFTKDLKIIKVTDFKNFSVIGTLNGNKKPICVLFNKRVYIASGGVLQVHDGNAWGGVLYNIPITLDGNSVRPDIIIERNGRLLASAIGLDYIFYSALLNGQDWEFDKANHTESDALFYEIGSPDSGDITAITQVMSDLIIFKSSRKVYRVINDHSMQHIEIKELSRNIECYNQNSVLPLINNAVFLDKQGLKSLETVKEFGDIKSDEIGKKINNYIINNITNSCELWDIVPKRQVWIKLNNSNEIKVYHYLNNAFTTFKFNNMLPISDVMVIDNLVYLAFGRTIYIYNGLKDDNGDIYTEIRTKKFTTMNNFLIKRVYANLGFKDDTVGEIDILSKNSGNIEIPFSVVDSDLFIFDDDYYIFGDDGYIQSNIDDVKIDKKCFSRTPSFEIFVKTHSGWVNVLELKIHVSEVGVYYGL